MIKIHTIICVGLVLTACSNKAVYDNIRLHERRECLKEASTSYSECIEQTDKSYEEYERERNSL